MLLLQKLDDVPAQVQWLVFLTGQYPPECISELFDDDDQDRLFKAMDWKIPDWMLENEEDEEDLYSRTGQMQLWEELCFKFPGWTILLVSSPVKTQTSPTSFSYSWGHTFNQIIAARTVDEALTKALAWSEGLKPAAAKPKKKKAKKK